MTCLVTNLVNNPEINGEIVELQRFLPDKQSWQVTAIKDDDPNPFLLKSINLDEIRAQSSRQNSARSDRDVSADLTLGEHVMISDCEQAAITALQAWYSELEPHLQSEYIAYLNIPHTHMLDSCENPLMDPVLYTVRYSSVIPGVSPPTI